MRNDYVYETTGNVWNNLEYEITWSFEGWVACLKNRNFAKQFHLRIYLKQFRVSLHNTLLEKPSIFWERIQSLKQFETIQSLNICFEKSAFLQNDTVYETVWNISNILRLNSFLKKYKHCASRFRQGNNLKDFKVLNFD